MDRTGGICQFCGYMQATQGHHLRYYPPVEQPAEWVVALCDLCHVWATEIRRVSGVAAGSGRLGYEKAVAAFYRAMPRMLVVLQEELAADVRRSVHQEAPNGPAPDSWI